MQGGEVLRTDARTFLKLYVHGILFSLLSTVLSLGWVFVAAFLIRFGFLVGLAIAIGLLVLLARVRERDGESPALVSRQRRLVGVLPTGVDHECRGRARPAADRGRFVPLFPDWRIGGGIPDSTASVRHRGSVGGGLLSAPRPSTPSRSDRSGEPGLSGVIHTIASGDLPTPRRLPDVRDRVRLRFGQHYAMSERRHAAPRVEPSGLRPSRIPLTSGRRRSGSATASGLGP